MIPYEMHKETNIFEHFKDFLDMDLIAEDDKLLIIGRTKFMRNYIHLIDLVIESYWINIRMIKIEPNVENYLKVAHFNRDYKRKIYIYMNGDPEAIVFSHF